MELFKFLLLLLFHLLVCIEFFVFLYIFNFYRNCTGNPNCLKGLGQPSWLIKNDDFPHDCDDNEFSLKRSSFCGLRNLGATCYLNTFLQVSVKIKL